jgi:hypothetical protein
LRKFNIGAGILHFVQGFLLLGASQGVQSIKDFAKDLTTSFLTYDEETQSLVSGTKVTGTYEVGLTAAIFLLMSGLAHALVLLNWDTYLRDLEREINRFRWYEYAVSSSLMIMSIAVLFGCYDVASLILIFFCNACMNFFGLLHERMNPPERLEVNWEPFIFGCIAGVAPWIVVWMYFLGGGNFDQIPGFVYGILVAYLIFFNTFPVNMVLQYKRVGKWAEYRYGELVYIFLSLIAKSLLAWLVFGGTFQPNGDD